MTFKNVLKNGKGYASLKNLIPFRNTEVAQEATSEQLNKIKRFVSEISEKTGISERTIYRGSSNSDEFIGRGKADDMGYGISG
jgi:hypothetical protein